jgi:hypothetical protein
MHRPSPPLRPAPRKTIEIQQTKRIHYPPTIIRGSSLRLARRVLVWTPKTAHNRVQTNLGTCKVAGKSPVRGEMKVRVVPQIRSILTLDRIPTIDLGLGRD